MISYTLQINSVSYDCEVGAVITLDGTETFDNGTIVIKETSKSSEFTEADKVVFTAGTKTFTLIVQADRVERVANTLYDHTITLTEETAKMVKSYSVDRFFSLNGTSLWTHNEILDRVRLTANLGKAPNYTIATATATALGTNAPQKKFEGMNEFQIATDIMRGINSVPRLENGVLTHTPYNETNNLIVFDKVTGWQKDNDYNNYATTIISRAKNITYDLDITTGSTWFPSRTESATPRANSGDYNDDSSQYQFGLDIRRINQIFIINYELSSGTFIDMDITDYVVSKEKWDGLQLGSRTQSTLQTQIAQRNTLYYTIGTNLLENMSQEFKDNLSATQITVKELVKSWLVNNGYLITDYKNFNISDLGIRANYQPYIEANISSDKWDTSVTKRSQILNGQKDTTLDIGRYGVVTDNIANRLSNGNWIIRVSHSSASDIFDLFDYTTDNYKIIKAKYEFYPEEIIGTYELNQYWSTINGYQSTYRTTDPYTIGRDNVNSNYRYTEYIEFSATNRTNTGSLTSQGYKTLLNILDYASADDIPVDLAIVDTSEITGYEIGMDIMSTGAKGLRFMTKFQEPKNAGYEIVSDSIGKGIQAIPYTDTEGYMETISMEFVNDYVTATTTRADEFPKITSATYTSLISLPTLTVYKNPNEIFGMNYELIPSTDDSNNIFVYNSFSRLNNLVNDGSISGLTIYYSNADTLYDIFDTAPKEVQGTEPLSGATVSKTLGYIDISAIPQNNVTWAVGTSDELLFAVNYDGTTFIDRLYINNLIERSTTESL